jgi:hypothetical protein
LLSVKADAQLAQVLYQRLLNNGNKRVGVIG